MKKITLQVNGKKMDFSEQELTAIVEKHLSNEDSKKATTVDVAKKIARTIDMAKKPTEDAWFEVKPHAIDMKLFEKKREDQRQERTRQLILEAFAEMNDYPEKYGKNFKTMMPKKTWSSKTVAELKEMASKLGDHNADWVEQAFEWAQRIANGESWKAICNDKDTANWYRLVVWKDGYPRLIGGSVNFDFSIPASNVGSNYCYDSNYLDNAVPLVALYEK